MMPGTIAAFVQSYYRFGDRIPSDHGCVIPGKASGWEHLWEDSRGKARLHLMTESYGG